MPGILYGGEKGPVAITVADKEFRKALYSGKLLGHMVTLRHKDEDQNVIAKAVQFHPVNDRPIHFDLYRVDADQEIKIAVSVHFINHELSPGLKRGGTMNVVRHEVEVLCHADHIPDHITYDLTGLDIGDTIRMSALSLPEGVKDAHPERDLVVATVAGAAAQIAEEAAEAAAAGDAGEGDDKEG